MFEAYSVVILFQWHMQVSVTLATLSFFCCRPTILAILEFVNAINVEDDSTDVSKEKSTEAGTERESSRNDLTDDTYSANLQEAVVKGLLGKGKSRVIFFLSLNMARAQILLMNENGTQLATLLQNNLLTVIKVQCAI